MESITHADFNEVENELPVATVPAPALELKESSKTENVDDRATSISKDAVEPSTKVEGVEDKPTLVSRRATRLDTQPEPRNSDADAPSPSAPQAVLDQMNLAEAKPPLRPSQFKPIDPTRLLSASKASVKKPPIEQDEAPQPAGFIDTLALEQLPENIWDLAGQFEDHLDTESIPWDTGPPVSRPPPVSKLSDPPTPEDEAYPDDQYTVDGTHADYEVLEDPPQITQWIAEEDFVPRMQDIHIVGFNEKTKYLAHKLSGSLIRPPVHWLVRDPQVPKAWDVLGQKITLRRRGDRIVHHRVVPELVVDRHRGFNRPLAPPPDDSLIDNLIITAPARAVHSELLPLVRRIDKNTVIMLFQEGLGIPEALNKSLFTDPEFRPKFVEAWFSGLIRPLKEDPFGVDEVVPGQLYVSTRIREPWQTTRAAPDPSLASATAFIKDLATFPDLDLVPCTRANFLFRKLPSMITTCIVESLSILVDGRYSQIPLGYPNNRLMDRMLMEICDVVCAFPEFRNDPYPLRYFNYERGYIRGRVLAGIKKRAKINGVSPMWLLVKNGKVTDLKYLNGYFAMRAEELGIPFPANEMVINLVKARHQAMLRDLKEDIMYHGWTRSMI